MASKAPHLTHLASHRYALQHHRLQTPSVAKLDPRLRETQSGYIHSIETAGTLDGPGIRFVAFLSGCHFRCQYCHNPDTWKLKHGLHVTVDDVMEEIERYADFLIDYRGGVTLSGGEVMVQDRFVTSLVRRIKERGIHIALDTNGYLGDHVGEQLMRDVDLWLLDIKAYDEELHTRVTGQSNAPVLDFARRLSDAGERTWDTLRAGAGPDGRRRRYRTPRGLRRIAQRHRAGRGPAVSSDGGFQVA